MKRHRPRKYAPHTKTRWVGKITIKEGRPSWIVVKGGFRSRQVHVRRGTRSCRASPALIRALWVGGASCLPSTTTSSCCPSTMEDTTMSFFPLQPCPDGEIREMVWAFSHNANSLANPLSPTISLANHLSRTQQTPQHPVIPDHHHHAHRRRGNKHVCHGTPASAAWPQRWRTSSKRRSHEEVCRLSC